MDWQRLIDQRAPTLLFVSKLLFFPGVILVFVGNLTDKFLFIPAGARVAVQDSLWYTGVPLAAMGSVIWLLIRSNQKHLEG